MASLFPTDTSPEAEAVQVSLLRSASPARRFAMARELTGLACSLSLRALKRARPWLSEREVALAFIEINYGAELAEKLRAQWPTGS